MHGATDVLDPLGPSKPPKTFKKKKQGFWPSGPPGPLALCCRDCAEGACYTRAYDAVGLRYPLLTLARLLSWTGEDSDDEFHLIGAYGPCVGECLGLDHYDSHWGTYRTQGPWGAQCPGPFRESKRITTSAARSGKQRTATAALKGK